MAYDLIVKGGSVVLEGRGVVECDIAVSDRKIAAIGRSDVHLDGEETFDAHGLVVFPGVIDPHVHFGMGSPGDWATESRAAAVGGVTSVLNYVMTAESYLESGPRERELAAENSVVDFGFHYIVMNEQHLAEIPAYVGELGVTSFKYFANFKGNEGAYLGVEGTDAGFFYALCRAVAEHPEAVLAVHPENIEVVWRLAAELKAAGRDDLAAWDEARPDFVEAHDMFTAFLFAERTGARVYIVHLSAAAGLRVAEEHFARGGRSYVETCTHYLTQTKHSELGTLAKVNPPVRTEADIEALWGAVRDGRISVVGSDHISRKREKKEGSIWTASAGFPGVTTLLPLMLSEGHHRRALSIERISAVLSTNPARIFGLYPTKGTIAIGSDADLTIVDLNREQVVDSSTFGSHADYSIYDGWNLRGWPVATLIRGETVMADGDVIALPGSGREISRRSGTPEASRA
jgi:dihydropyrimidinase